MSSRKDFDELTEIVFWPSFYFAVAGLAVLCWAGY
jgi:hypothetical protein